MRIRSSVPVTLVMVLALVGIGLVPAAIAQTENLACPAALVTDAGFTDVSSTSVHKADIDCVAWYEITTGTSLTTYNPSGLVTRWQMALFLVRTFATPWGSAIVSGADQGFTDIGGLSAEARLAVNQLSQLSITSGTTATTFSPNDTVSRWQMALFLTRLMRAFGMALPDGADQGFADIGHLPATVQTAINQLAQLGITSGISPRTFNPDGAVTREQMASFLARTLEADGWMAVLIRGTRTCQGATCTFDGTYPANTRIVFKEGVSWNPLPAPASFYTSAARLEMTMDGQPMATTERLVTLNDIVQKWTEATFPSGLSGTHVFVLTWYFDNQVWATQTMTIQFTS